MANKNVDYRKLSDELDTILNRLQSGELGIDEAVPAYERGMQLVKELEKYLQTAENRITELQAKLQD
ncbi:MAG: Exonuclease small subunit [Candidatus Saccharibacteria bacterium]|nr:Exonuclease small subunit [Candidatus Saccharibacteria bacterium]